MHRTYIDIDSFEETDALNTPQKMKDKSNNVKDRKTGRKGAVRPTLDFKNDYFWNEGGLSFYSERIVGSNLIRSTGA